ncbi:MAG: aminodeoxychorismate/anthranilate synthase component II [Bacteroidia bacterium]|nr:aminodeoxychorismate/anthranilate synthase component II [Bacteroidia bacterium]MDW8134914.1 aminodeoxychorismate/anthranilate synthase component II [Bacteroidia bacterium]
MTRPRILLIDNHDSFTYNIVALLHLAGSEVGVRTVEDIFPAEIYHYPWAGIVIGPGPGHPAQLAEVLPSLLPPASHIPILGICLGHQYIVYALGGKVEPMKRPLFGVQRYIHHTGEGLFRDVPNPLPVGLYHALHATYIPPALEVVAHDEEGHCMAVRHSEYPIWGLQFHPDSILTPHGLEIIKSWVATFHSVAPHKIV